MRRLSVIELMAVIFTGLAGVAASVQAYVSWQTRDEVARAIVFSERIDACADMLAAVNFVTQKATPAARKAVARVETTQRFRSQYFLGEDAMSSPQRMNDTLRPFLTSFRRAAASFRIVMPEELEPLIQFFERVVLLEVPRGEGVDREAFIKYLEEIDKHTQMLVDSCRRLS